MKYLIRECPDVVTTRCVLKPLATMTLSNVDKNYWHEKYKHEAILVLGSRPDTRCFPNETGAAHCLADQYLAPGERRIIKYGQKGSADILGFTVIYNLPIFFGVEVKSGKAVQQKNQKDYEIMLNGFNGIYIIHRGNTAKLIRDFNDARNRCRTIVRKAWNESVTHSWGKR